MTPTPAVEPVLTPMPDPPRLVADLAGILQWCESYVGPDPFEVQPIICTDAIELALRSLGSLQGSVFRADVSYRPPCIPDRCPPQSADRAYVVLLSRAATPLLIQVARDTDGGLYVFPAQPGPAPAPAPVFEPPPVQRPDFPGAPPEVRNREPYPFCGRLEPFSEEKAFGRCFVLAVESGSPAELIADHFSIEGDPITIVYRFSGAGAVTKWFDSTRDPLSNRQWHLRTCAMYRSEDPFSFGCD